MNLLNVENPYFWILTLVVIIIFCLSYATMIPQIQSGGHYDPFRITPNHPDRDVDFSQIYLGGPTKCFSCEKDLIRRGGPYHLAHSTRCFSCEQQAIQQHGQKAFQFGQPNKCFSCEAQQIGNNPFKHDFGGINGEGFDDKLQLEGVGLPTKYGRAVGLTRHEYNTQNPMEYGLTMQH